MGFSPTHCEQCGQEAGEYFPSYPLTVCEKCAGPELVSAWRADQAQTPHRRYPGQTNRERNAQLRDDYLEETSCECGEYQPHFLKFYKDGKIDGTVSNLVDRGVAAEDLQKAMESCVVQCRLCRSK